MGEQLRAVTIGALIAVVGVLIGSIDQVTQEGRLVAAAILGVIVIAVGLRPGRVIVSTREDGPARLHRPEVDQED